MADEDFDSWLHGTDDVAPDDGLTVGKQRLCELIGVAPKTVDRMRRDGCPHTGSGRALVFRVPDVVQWLLSANSIDESKRRALDATARKREVEAARLEGRFVDIDDVEDVIRDQVAKLQSELLAIPARLPAAVRKLAEGEIQAALNRLSFDGVQDDA